MHPEQLLACIAAGKYTLCEKPLTMDAASSLQVVEAERAAGKPLIQVGFMRRFDPEYAAMKKLLDCGELGRLLLLHNVHRNKDVPDTFRSEMIVRDSLVHEVDVCRWLFGEEIDEITVYSPAPTSRAAEGVIDPQVAVFRMAGGGMATTEVFVKCAVGYEVRCEATAELGNATVGLGTACSSGPTTAGAATCRTTSGCASAPPTTTRSSPGSTPPAAARSPGRRPGTATRPPSSARPGWSRCAPALREGGAGMKLEHLC